MNKEEIVKTLVSAEKEYGIVETLHTFFGSNIKTRIPFSKTACELSVDELVLSVRGYNALRRAGILTIGDLLNRLNAGDVKNIRNLGLKSFSEIQTKILDFGFERLNEKEKHEFFWYLLENNAV